jgi:hypothetical protein
MIQRANIHRNLQPVISGVLLGDRLPISCQRHDHHNRGHHSRRSGNVRSVGLLSGRWVKH